MPPPSRLARNAWIVVLATSFNAAILYVAAEIFLRNDPHNRLTFHGMAYSVVFVGCAWSVILAFRALRRGERRAPAVALLAAIQILMLAYGIHLWSLLAHAGQAPSYYDWRFEWFLPILFPFIPIASTSALIAKKIHDRVRNVPLSPPGERVGVRGQRVTIALTIVLLALLLLPAPTFLLSVLRANTPVHNFICTHTPDLFRDPVESFLHSGAVRSWRTHIIVAGWASESRLAERAGDMSNVELALEAVWGISRGSKRATFPVALKFYKDSANPSLPQRYRDASVMLLQDAATPMQLRELFESIANDDPAAHKAMYRNLVVGPRQKTELLPVLAQIVQKHPTAVEPLNPLLRLMPKDELAQFAKSILEGSDQARKEAFADAAGVRAELFCTIMKNGDKTLFRRALHSGWYWCRWYGIPFNHITDPAVQREVAQHLLNKFSDDDIVQRRGAFWITDAYIYAFEASESIRCSPHMTDGVGGGNTLYGAVPVPESPGEKEALDRHAKFLKAWLDKTKKP